MKNTFFVFHLFFGLLVTLFFMGSCTQPIETPDDQITTAEGLAIVRIPLTGPESRAVTEVLVDPFKPRYINYYEAVMKVHGAQEYFVGTAQVGMSFLSIAVVPEKEYDVLVLAGIDNAGEKVLLASGFADNGGAGIPVRYGQRTVIPVPMKLHTVTLGMYDDTAPASAEKMFPIIEKNGISHVQVWNINNLDGLNYKHDFHYQADITGIEALAEAEGGSVTALNPRIEPAAKFTAQAVSYTAVPNPALRVSALIPQSLIPVSPDTDSYPSYFNAEYYAFGIQKPEFKKWNIRRGVTNTTHAPLGGGVQITFGDPMESMFFVRKPGGPNGGLNTNPGTFNAPFQTLAHAIVQARAHPSIRSICIIGELDNASENAGNNNGVFVITGGTGIDIGITGVHDGVTPARLKGGNSKRVLYINTADRIWLDRIEITGGSISGSNIGGGVWIRNTQVTLGTGLKVYGNTNTAYRGGGVGVTDGGRLVMNTGAEIYSNTAPATGHCGGGVLIENGTFTLNGGSIKANTAKYGGGVFLWGDNYNTTLTMYGGVIQGNTGTNSGGGVNVRGDYARFTMYGGSIINNLSGNADIPAGGVRIEVRAEMIMYAGKIADNYIGANTVNVCGNNGRFTCPTRPSLSRTMPPTATITENIIIPE